jgi:hypothetical protein
VSKKRKKRSESTLAALLRDKQRRGRPPREVSRQNVYVELSKEQKTLLTDIAGRLPEDFVRADVPDLAVMVLAARIERLRRAVAGRTREIPEGVTDMESLYLLWDLPLHEFENVERWTTVRLSPQQAIELGRVHGTLNALFGATRSEVFSLALTLLNNFVANDLDERSPTTLLDMHTYILDIFL